jgi:hypothetical protein
MILTMSDGDYRYRVLLPPTALLDGDQVVVPDEDGEPCTLADWVIIESARFEVYGLKLLSEQAIGGKHGCEPISGHDAPH